MVRDILWLIALMSVGVFFCMLLGGKGNVKIISPLAFSAFTAYAEEPVLVPQTTEQAKVVAYIREVFGQDADKALLLLTCENGSLNPKAENTAGNFPEGSVDRGIFQINSYWQKVENKAFLFDYKINTQIAYNI